MSFWILVFGIITLITWVGYEVWRAPLADEDGVIIPPKKSSDSNSENP